MAQLQLLMDTFMLHTKITAIRRLTVEELPLCVPFGQAFHEEMKLPGQFIPAIFVQNWTTYLTRFPFPAAILSLWSGDELIGGIGIVVTPDQNDGRLCAMEFFLYVTPAHRKGTGLLRLLRAFKAWCFDNGVVEGRLVRLLTDGDTAQSDSLDKVYRKLGGQPVEVAYRIPIESPIPIWSEEN